MTVRSDNKLQIWGKKEDVIAFLKYIKGRDAYGTDCDFSLNRLYPVPHEARRRGKRESLLWQRKHWGTYEITGIKGDSLTIDVLPDRYGIQLWFCTYDDPPIPWLEYICKRFRNIKFKLLWWMEDNYEVGMASTLKDGTFFSDLIDETENPEEYEMMVNIWKNSLHFHADRMGMIENAELKAEILGQEWPVKQKVESF